MMETIYIMETETPYYLYMYIDPIGRLNTKILVYTYIKVFAKRN